MSEQVFVMKSTDPSGQRQFGFVGAGRPEGTAGALAGAPRASERRSAGEASPRRDGATPRPYGNGMCVEGGPREPLIHDEGAPFRAPFDTHALERT